ncbi:class I SAM-dependent methyltransferase [Sphingomonas arantia]|uniref:Class I SAM-dependent methyltransferase n=1 Tax=Sphingomonas arantia TaxID=1460676 RepID=A0ABW4TX89_9SPHN
MLVHDAAALAALLACPACNGPLAGTPDDPACRTESCDRRDVPLDRIDGKAVLVDFDRSILDRDAMLATGGASVLGRDRWRQVLSRVVDGRNHFSAHYARTMIADLAASNGTRRPVILIVGGGAIGSGAEPLYASPDVDLVAFDIYVSPHITFVADGHAIPLQDASVDAVWVQAVLEHTVDPFAIVAEMTRVLRPGGLVFANTAFLWPVCEHAYDFMRFTTSGLRWLFRDFDVMSVGYSSGPGTTAALAIRYLAQSLLRSTKLGQIAAFPFVWLRLLDRWCDGRRGLDGASALFFYGRKADRPLALDALVPFYAAQPALARAAQRNRD